MAMIPEITDGLGPGEDEIAIGVLRKVNANGRLGRKLFTEIARIIPQPIVEIVVLRMRDGRVETLLIPRPEGDPVWPGMVHSPGVAIRNSDLREEGVDSAPVSAVERVESEIGNPLLAEPELVGVYNQKTRRGGVASQIYFAEIAPDAGLPEGAFWHPVDELPTLDNFIPDQYPFIELAARYYAHRISPPPLGVEFV